MTPRWPAPSPTRISPRRCRRRTWPRPSPMRRCKPPSPTARSRGARQRRSAVRFQRGRTQRGVRRRQPHEGFRQGECAGRHSQCRVQKRAGGSSLSAGLKDAQLQSAMADADLQSALSRAEVRNALGNARRPGGARRQQRACRAGVPRAALRPAARRPARCFQPTRRCRERSPIRRSGGAASSSFQQALKFRGPGGGAEGAADGAGARGAGTAVDACIGGSEAAARGGGDAGRASFQRDAGGAQAERVCIRAPSAGICQRAGTRDELTVEPRFDLHAPGPLPARRVLLSPATLVLR